jgi:hypothetical protein
MKPSTEIDCVFNTKYGKLCSKKIEELVLKMLFFEFQEQYETCAKLNKEKCIFLNDLAITAVSDFNLTVDEIYILFINEYDSQLRQKRVQLNKNK